MATVGAGALTFGGAVLPAAAESSDAPIAINTDADKYELAAGYTNSTVSEVKELVEGEAAEITDDGLILHVDPAFEGAPSSASDSRVELNAAAVPGDAAGGSRPGAPVTVYLDFDGETLEGTRWNVDANKAALPFVAASAATPAVQDQVWAAVAEDFAPFNINVTTTRPSDDKLYKTSTGDNEYGVHVIVTDSYSEVLPSAAGTSGLAWHTGAGSDWLTGALVFTSGMALDPSNATAKDIADTASHEAAHNFGLIHDGLAGSPAVEYYSPTDGVWGPIMGSTYDVPLTQWSNGSYANSSNKEDDLAVITDRGAAGYLPVRVTYTDGTPFTGEFVCGVNGASINNPKPGDQFYVPNAENLCDGTGAPLVVVFTYKDRADFAADDFGNDAAGAHAISTPAGPFTETAGVIGQSADVDVFSVSAAAGPFSAAVEVADVGPNLDAKLTLTDSSGAVLATSTEVGTRVSADTASGLGATVSTTVDGGVYYLTVQGQGQGNPETATALNSNGYTAYGSLGNYTISGEAVPVQPVVIDTPADGAAVADGEDVEVTGTASPGATVTLTVDGTAVATAEADEDGNWTATVASHEYGNTVIVASQTLGSDVLPETDTVTVTAPVAAPVVTAPADGSTTDDNTPTLSGTGIPGSTVAITLTSASGGTIVTSATVNAEGNWSVDVAEAIGNGVYTVSATQSINGVTSAASEEVSFTVNAVITNPDTGANGNGTGTGNNTGELATTGGDFSSMLIVALIAAALVAGGGAAAFGLRRKKVASES
ncbi:Ig-like domain-containing protein [Microbacterium sp. ZW T5_45]|uniref:Ig-like domain-containing protein n=1 Tax=Microbacterium sp. ZW T5_45 TaxID=3378080 RepID=UPI0038544782